MSLSKLPAEIFKITIHHVVLEAGMNRAWTLRQVNRIFAAEIKHDILTHQTRNVIEPLLPELVTFESESVFPKDIIGENIEYYLHSCLINPLDASKPFIAKVRQLIEFVCEEQKIVVEAARRDCSSLLCQGLVAMLGERRIIDML
ncbi:unnamed protein product [Periconia digitata]|uniref:Uncharacterized protein n=1 Tax=Periconia digitata TaxID=1303443 RepID=A0A9W4XQC5_9PLEO|nr:unnamed protein product [Periconia digitata]